jgi:hypothetical protein
MKKATLILAALGGILFSLVNPASAQDLTSSSKPGPAAPASSLTAKLDQPAETRAKAATSEVEALKHRIEEVENQNRALIQIVTELKARLETGGLGLRGQPASAWECAIAVAARASRQKSARALVRPGRRRQPHQVLWIFAARS